MVIAPVMRPIGPQKSEISRIYEPMATEEKKTSSPKAAPKTAPKASSKKKAVAPLCAGVGRRKASVARVWLRPGAGTVRVNGQKMEEYFDTVPMQHAVKMPFTVCPVSAGYDVQANVCGGGKRGQADAVKLAISRALIQNDTTLRPVLKKESLLKVDSRTKERKKYGQRGARRKFQFVKR